MKQFLAWMAHAYTALGLVLAAGMAVLIVRGGAAGFRDVFLLMMLATFIDATDGTFARLVKVKQVLPGFDGRRLDDIIDFLTYTALPLLLLWRAEILPGELAWLLLVPLVASAYGFCQVNAKTADGYFLGFPSYWNIVSFYLYALRPSPIIASVILVTLAILTFVPLRYLYPSQRGWLNQVTALLGLLWMPLFGWAIYTLPVSDEVMAVQAADRAALYASLAFPVYYMAASLWASLRRRGQPAIAA